VTPQQHIDEAERIVGLVTDRQVTELPDVYGGLLLLAAVHALIALAVEGGVPHQATATAAT
jgi:hypothetical protein